MTIRETMEQFEKEHLSPYASLSCNSKGRETPEEECDIRPVYQRDRDRILHSKSFRRLKHKTQVFLAPEGDHYRTRLTHTLEVSQNARTIAKALRLNEDLVEAIALGHDLGHTPFGHCGEAALNDVCPEGFAHNEQSVRVVQYLEKKGRGLNLTWEVRDGILNHQTKSIPATLEGKVVRFSDKIAYINHDIDDAIRAQVISEEDIPSEYRDILGHTTRDRLNTLIHSIISESMDKDDISMAPDIEEAMKGLRLFMFENVYTNPNAKAQEKKARDLIIELYEYYNKHFDLLSPKYKFIYEHYNQSKERVVCDYIAGMTDQYAILHFQELRVPTSWKVK